MTIYAGLFSNHDHVFETETAFETQDELAEYIKDNAFQQLSDTLYQNDRFTLSVQPGY